METQNEKSFTLDSSRKSQTNSASKMAPKYPKKELSHSNKSTKVLPSKRNASKSVTKPRSARQSISKENIQTKRKISREAINRLSTPKGNKGNLEKNENSKIDLAKRKNPFQKQREPLNVIGNSGKKNDKLPPYYTPKKSSFKRNNCLKKLKSFDNIRGKNEGNKENTCPNKEKLKELAPSDYSCNKNTDSILIENMELL